MTVISNNPSSDLKFTPPDGGWGWIVVISSFLIHLIMDGITYSLGTYLTLFVESFNVSHGAASFVHALLPAITLSCGPIASMFTNRYGCRITTIIGSIIAAFGFIISYFATNFYVLYLTIGVVVGIGFGLIYVPAIVSVGYYFEARRSFAIGIAVCGSGVGTFILSPLNRILTERYGWEGAFLIKAGFVLNSCVCGAVMRPVPIEPSELLKHKKKSKQNKEIEENLSLLKNKENKSKELKSDNLESICTSNQNFPPKIFITDGNSSGFKDPDNSNMKSSKIGDSLPSVYIENNRKQLGTSNTEINSSVQFKSPINLDIDINEFAKSMPTITDDQITSKTKNSLNYDTQTNSFEQTQLKHMYSSMDIMAHVRSLQNIPVSNQKLNEIETNSKKNKKILTNDKSKGIKKLNDIIDLSLFMDVVFIYFAISNFLTSLGFNAPFIYIVDQATSLNINGKQADWLLSTIGISNTVGRVILGLVSDIKSVNRLYLYSAVLTICGIATIVEPFFTSFVGLLIYAIVFGFTSGGYVSITSVLLVDLLGLDKLTNAFGILLVFQGIATAIGPPAVGHMYDVFKSYTFPFMFTGTMIAISGFMCFFIPCFRSYKKKKNNTVN